MKRVRFDVHNSSKQCGNTDLEALSERPSVVGTAYLAREVCRDAQWGNTVFETVSDGSRARDAVYYVSRGL